MTEPRIEALSIRTGDRPVAVRHPGVPRHLDGPLRAWLRSFLTDRLSQRVALRIGHLIAQTPTGELRLAMNTVRGTGHLDDGLVGAELLDAVDIALQLDPWATDQLGWAQLLPVIDDPDQRFPRLDQIQDLEEMLDDAGSMYRVGVENSRFQLLRRVDPTVQAGVEHAAAVASPTAGQLLRQAWVKTYAREQDPNAAYSTAVRAVEQVACPLVRPDRPKATLGDVIRHLRTEAPEQWSFVLLDTHGDDSTTPVTEMMSRLWTGHISRHAGGQHNRDQTQAEAEAAVHLATTLVQLLSTGALTRRDES